MNLIDFFLFVLFFLSSFGLAQDDSDDAEDDPFVDPPLPSSIRITCTGHDLDLDGRISTTARLMDWCYCGNTLNSDGLTYAGMSVYEDSAHASGRKAMRTWVCSKHRDDPCDDFEQWYYALGNLTDECTFGKSGIYYDPKQQKAWGFETKDQASYCDSVNWE